MPSLSPIPLALTALAASSMVLSGCAGAPAAHRAAVAAPHLGVTSTATNPASARTTPSGYLAATATKASVGIYDHPAGRLVERLANPIPAGAPLTLLVTVEQGTWLKVDLAQRPNGSTGWVKADTVSLHSLLYHLRVSTETNTMTLSRGARLIRTFAVATGTGGTPTPHGTFYLTELLAPTNPGYGPYAFGLSAFSTAITSFGGGPGQIGLHGTADASSIGKSASHGCIRLHNQDITMLANTLPLGTPVTIE
jgi:lipoprotein-anchoring transpeptidase ErfK/SrfK